MQRTPRFSDSTALNPSETACRGGARGRQRERGDGAVGGQRAGGAAGERGAAAGLGGRDRLGHLRLLLARRGLLHRQVGLGSGSLRRGLYKIVQSAVWGCGVGRLVEDWALQVMRR